MKEKQEIVAGMKLIHRLLPRNAFRNAEEPAVL
jgi:hypothetical protein